MLNLPGPKGHFLWGNAFMLNPQKFHKIIADWAQQFGKIYLIKIFWRKMIVINDPQEIVKILKERPKNFRRKSSVAKNLDEMGIHGLFGAEGDEWIQQKRVLSKGFSSSQITSFLPQVFDIASRFKKKLLVEADSKKVQDIRKIMSDYTLDVTTNFAFGYNGNAIESDSSHFQNLVNFLFEKLNFRVQAFFPYWRFFKLPSDYKFENYLEEVNDLINLYIEKAKSELTLEKNPKTILHAMILAGENESIPFSDRELRGNILTLLLAGIDTTANTLSWALYYLASHQTLVAKLRTELPPFPDKLKAEDYRLVDENKTLEGLIKETMRLRPVAPFMLLENKFPMSLDNVTIPLGTDLVTNFLALYQNSELFPHPLEFDPFRWEKLDKSDYENYFFPFGAGPRICLGKGLSHLEMKVVLWMLISQFDFSAGRPLEEVEEEFNFTLNPKNLFLIFHNAKRPSQKYP